MSEAVVLRVGRMGPGDILRIATAGLGSRRLRSALTALGIAIGIAAMLAVLGIAESSRATLLAELDRIGSNLLTVGSGQTFLGDDASLPEESTSMIDRIGPVESASSVSAVPATVRKTDLISEAETSGIAVQATDHDLLDTLGGTLAAGRFIDEALDGYPAVVLGAIAAERLGITALDHPVLVWIDDSWWSVVGILDPLPLAPEIDRSALIGREIAEANGADMAPTTIYVRAEDAFINDVRAVLGPTADPEHPEAVEVSRPSDAIEAKAAAATAFTSLFLGLGAVAVLVLRRALGATRGHIVGQFLAEAVLLAGFGGVIGAVLGAAIAALYASSQGWLIALPIAGLVVGVAAAGAVGGLAGIYPALRAANTPPTDALRS
jgi:putative ABC transport system permease protein